ncbi:MAG: hypothetical protein SOY83_01320 [Anaerovoracaceae bacterium]|nr:hypothetical protein [Bacillota bacterium]MDY3954114.1 hypothetical protein [Anaerovoracaceae bacterium]
MHAIERYELERAAELLTLAYQNDTKTQLEMDGVENSEELLAIRAKDYLETLFGRGAVWIEETQPKSILVAFQSKRFSNMRYLTMLRTSMNHIAEAAGKERLKKMAENGKKMKRLEDYVWHRKVPKKKKDTYYHLLTVFIEPESLDTDHVYDMLEPFMSYCDRYAMPMTYESWNPEMTEIMKNLCFEVRKTKEVKACPGVTVCHMVRQPQRDEAENSGTEPQKSVEDTDDLYEGETDYE